MDQEIGSPLFVKDTRLEFSCNSFFSFLLGCNVPFHCTYRLSKDRDTHSCVIDWLELERAVQKQSCK